jgi:hypothetical protein
MGTTTTEYVYVHPQFNLRYSHENLSLPKEEFIEKEKKKTAKNEVRKTFRHV